MDYFFLCNTGLFKKGKKEKEKNKEHVIHQPMIKRVYAECTPLFQLIKLLNKMRNDPLDTILESIEQMNLSYRQLSYNISKTYLNTYDPICRIENCFVCINR